MDVFQFSLTGKKCFCCVWSKSNNEKKWWISVFDLTLTHSSYLECAIFGMCWNLLTHYCWVMMIMLIEQNERVFSPKNFILTPAITLNVLCTPVFSQTFYRNTNEIFQMMFGKHFKWNIIVLFPFLLESWKKRSILTIDKS